MNPRTTTLSCGLAVTATLVALTGCGGSGDDSKDSSSSKAPEKTTAQAPASTGGGAKLALAADPGGKIAFDKKALTAKAGATTIDFTNASQVPHAVEIEGNGVEKETKTIQGSKASVEVDLKPGRYTFYCPVSDHREEGMEGTLTVK